MDPSDIGLIGAIVGIIALITFFVMAWRLGNLSHYVKQIGNRLSNQPFFEAQTAEILDRKDEAIEKYIAVLYLVTFAGYQVPKRTKQQSSVFVADKIKKFGGAIPDLLIEKNQFLSKE